MKDTALCAKIDLDLKQRLVAACHQNGHTVSDVLRALISGYVDQERGPALFRPDLIETVKADLSDFSPA